ncbi:MAG: hypothetical protein ACRBDI_04720 [Alphaproteobacteria bacterium]
MTIGSFNTEGSRVRGNVEAAADVPMFDTFQTMAKSHEPLGGFGMNVNLKSDPSNLALG